MYMPMHGTLHACMHALFVDMFFNVCVLECMHAHVTCTRMHACSLHLIL